MIARLDSQLKSKLLVLMGMYYQNWIRHDVALPEMN
jgi:hypothetical protein